MNRSHSTSLLLALALGLNLLQPHPLGAQPTNAIRKPTPSVKRPTSPLTPPTLRVQPGQPAPRTFTTNRPPPVLFGGQAQPSITIQGQPAPAAGSSDPLLNLMLTQPSIDIDSPAMVLAEFDPAIIPVGGQGTYRLVITTLNEVITPPDQLPAPPALQLTPGGRGHSFFTLNNKMQPRTTLNYRVTASAPGIHTIPPFSLSVGGKLVQVPSTRLQVVPAGTLATPPTPKLTVRIPQGNIYVGQSVPIQVSLTDPDGNSVRGLTRVEVTSEGFMTDTTFYRQRREIVTVDGKPMAALSQETYITPLKAGELELVAQAQALLARPSPALGVQLPGYYPLLDADPVKITVKRLPREGELPGFTGAIGTFTLEQPRLSTNQVRAGEPLTLTVSFRGQGNLARLVPPKIEGLWEWQTFEPTSDNVQPQIVQQRGSVSFNYTLIPLSDRITATPRIPFSYFDPALESYAELTIPPLPVQVLPAPDGASLASAGPGALGAARDDRRDAGERDLVMNGLSESPGVIASTLLPLQQRPWFIAFQFLPVLALGGLWAWDRRRRFLEQHPEVRLKSQARRGMRRQQRLLRRAAAAHDAGAFIRAAINALRHASAPHDAANPEALVCGDVLQAIPVPARNGPSGEVVRRLFVAADHMRFGGGLPDGQQILALRAEIERLLNELRAKL